MADDKDDLDLYILKSFCVALGLTSLGCTGTGMFTLIYAAPTVGYPYGIASGVWTGVFVSYRCNNYSYLKKNS